MGEGWAGGEHEGVGSLEEQVERAGKWVVINKAPGIGASSGGDNLLMPCYGKSSPLPLVLVQGNPVMMEVDGLKQGC